MDIDKPSMELCPLIFTMVILLSQDTLHKKIATKPNCGQQQQVEADGKQICTLQKASAERLDDNNAQATSQVTAVGVDRCDKPHAKRTHRQTSNEIQKNFRPDISVIDTDGMEKDRIQIVKEHPGCQITRETVTTDQHDELIKMGIKPTLKGYKEIVSLWNGECSFLFTSSSAPYDRYEGCKCQHTRGWRDEENLLSYRINDDLMEINAAIYSAVGSLFNTAIGPSLLFLKDDKLR
ncbi:hypothetical protein Tco_1164174 [Tanacetum coccineum]